MTRSPGKPYASANALREAIAASLSQRLAALDIHTAIREELSRQGLVMPATFAVPDAATWEPAYHSYARRLPHLRGIDFEQAVALAKGFLDPVLAGGAMAGGSRSGADGSPDIGWGSGSGVWTAS